VLLYNLGMAYSDVGKLDRAVTLLRRLLTVQPGHANGRVALGTALVRQHRHEEARVELERAVADDPSNPWAHSNLGACLLSLERAEEAVGHLRKATELQPTYERAWCGLGQALEATGDTAGADEAYRQTLALAEVGPAADIAREARSRIAAEAFRQAMPGTPRMDAVMYCLGALERFGQMTPDEIQKVGFEIAVLGMGGLDVNDPTPQYRLRNLAGEFSGLHLVSLQYVAFKITAPGQNIGFDLAQEYEAAKALHGARG
jgi:tetratricopeptide (TPR) repeat protein